VEDLLKGRNTELASLKENIEASEKRIKELLEEIGSKDLELSLMKISSNSPLDSLFMSQQLYISC
jgi:hypothetical protein